MIPSSYSQLKSAFTIILLVLYYRPPSSTAEELSLLESYLETIPPTLLCSAILLGDFNINLLSPNHTSHQLHSLTSKMNFTQVVQQPTKTFQLSHWSHLSKWTWISWICWSNPSPWLFRSQLYLHKHKASSAPGEPQTTHYLEIQPGRLWYRQQSPFRISIWPTTVQQHWLFLDPVEGQVFVHNVPFQTKFLHK